jgi:glycine betaine/choline ABC-type transport system substrate-binding protein
VGSAPHRPRTARQQPRWLLAILAVALTLGSAACDRSANVVTGRPELDGVHLTIGATRMDDSLLLAEIYAQALEAKGATVTRRNRLGTRKDYYPLLEKGTIDLVPERSGQLLRWLRSDATTTPKTVSDQLTALEEVLPPSLAVLSPTGAADNDSIVCAEHVAADHDLRTITELQHAGADLVVGVTADERPVFGPLFHTVTPLADDDAVADALDEGAIDCGTLHASDPRITREHLVALDDDLLLVPSDVIVPLIDRSDATPAIQAVLDAASSTLDTVALRGLLAEVELDGDQPAKVVRDWIDQNGLGG